MKKAIILAGPSAVGKTTLAEYMIKNGAPLELVRSVTTRAPRGDGHDGEYIYFTAREFERAVRDGEFLEYTEYAGAFYGTPKSEVERISEAGKIPLMILDINGARSIKSADECPTLAVYLFERIDTLEERLHARYLGKKQTPEGLSSFLKRKERNLSELASVGDFAEVFDLIQKNSFLKEASIAILSAYENGVSEEEKADAIAEIKAMLEEKTELSAP